MILYILFWIFFFILFYTYIGYPVALWGIIRLKKLFSPSKSLHYSEYEPHVCLFVTAYNEIDVVEQKVKNSQQLDYPPGKVQYLWVTDGSNDGTNSLLKQFPQNEVHHQPARKGKMHEIRKSVV